MARKTKKRSTPSGPPPKAVLCVGLKSSGSTWLYNVVIQLLTEKYGGGVCAFYADNFAMFPPGTEHARVLVIKAHEPSKSLVYLSRLTRGEVFLTLREPRDAIVSLMQRFEHGFDGALKETARHAARIAELDAEEDMITYRYEDGFFDRFETVGEIAGALGIKIGKAALMRIHRNLTRDEVRKTIGGLKKSGRFGKKPNADSFDPGTHWHPGHVGDGKIGKFAGLLSPAQQKKVLSVTPAYAKRFGYLSRKK
ncbi:MAG TPA: hypothetical protein VHE09_01585 [Rhizomicrobium sp.]|jgi:hypothetical protein|nr:hypothetical protein [Rhizomicrobium sp.]